MVKIPLSMNHLRLIVYDDALLLQQISEGSKEAFNLLYEKYWQKTFADAYKRLQDEDASKDIVQEIFTHIWLKKETLRIENLPAYLNISVRNRVFKFAATLQLKHPFFEILETMPGGVQADADLLWKEFFLSYEALLDTLPEKRRQIFKMRFQENLSTADIALQLGLSRKTVQNQLGKAVDQLRISLVNLLSIMVVLLAGSEC